MFDNRLGKIDLTHGSSIDHFPNDDVFGYFSDEGPTTIHIDRSVTHRRVFINVLAHEMIHQLQSERGLPTNHGWYFRKQAERLQRLGVNP